MPRKSVQIRVSDLLIDNGAIMLNSFLPTVSVSANLTAWPSQLIVPPNSTVEIYCRLEENTEPVLLIDLAEDTVGLLPFSSRRELLNEHSVFELPHVTPPTLGLLVNDTNRNNQTVIVCSGVEESRQTILFIQGR